MLLPEIYSLRAFAFAVTLTAGSVAGAATIAIDQSQLDGSFYLATFSQAGLAQSFQQSNNNISGASILLQAGAGSGTGDITIGVWTALPNDPSASLLASAVAFGMEPGEWAVVDFGGSVAVTPATTLYLSFGSSNDSFGIAGSVNNLYALGNTFANSGYTSYPGLDYAFKTFASVDDVSAVPEPSGVLVLGCLLGSALTLRTSRKS